MLFPFLGNRFSILFYFYFWAGTFYLYKKLVYFFKKIYLDKLLSSLHSYLDDLDIAKDIGHWV